MNLLPLLKFIPSSFSERLWRAFSETGLNFLLSFFTAMGCRITRFFSPQNSKDKYYQLGSRFCWVLFVFYYCFTPFTRIIFKWIRWWKNRYLFILIGFLLQQILEFLSSGIEHGHIHHLHGGESKSRANYCDARFIYSWRSWRHLLLTTIWSE